jgi:thioredoxin 1
MHLKRFKFEIILLSFAIMLLFARQAVPSAPVQPEVPVKGMVTMIDLGAKKCIPCKMMAPILEKLGKEYTGRAAIVFLDVWEDRAPAKRFAIKGIPTQIFFDKEGKEVFRHLGFLSEEEIVRRLKEMGVK